MKKIITAIVLVALLATMVIPFSAGAATTGNPLELSFKLTGNSEGATEITNLDQLKLLQGQKVRLYSYLDNYDSEGGVTPFYRFNTYFNIPAGLTLDLHTPSNVTTAFGGVIPGAEITPYIGNSNFSFKLSGNATLVKNQYVAASTTATKFNKKATAGKLSAGYFVFTVGDLSAISEVKFEYIVLPENTTSGQAGGAITTGVSNDSLKAQDKTLPVPVVHNLSIKEAVTLPLVNSVTFAGKDATGSHYTVALNPEEGISYKAYVKDAVYGWTLARAYAAYTEAFDITVANPTNPLELEVLAADTSVASGAVIATPTYKKTLKELGQLGIASATLNKTSFNVGETITLNATVDLPSTVASANYEIYFGDSQKGFKGTTSGAASASSVTKKPGTYKATVRFSDPAMPSNAIVETISYTVVEAAPANLPYFNKDDNNKFTFKKNADETLTPKNLSVNQNGFANATFYQYRFVAPGFEDILKNQNTVLKITKPGIYKAFADIISGGMVLDTAYTTVKIDRVGAPVTITEFKDTIVSGTHTFTVTAPAATQFMFVRRDETGYRTVKKWSSDNFWTWTPARDGRYEISVYVMGDEAGSYEAMETKTVTVGEIDEEVVVPTPTVSQLLAGKATALSIAEPVVGLSYAYEIYDPFSGEFIFSGYSATGEFTFVPAKARKYRITTLVKADSNSGAYDNKDFIEVTFN